MNLPALRAFRSRNYRYFFAGQLVSLLGTWMQKTAVSWVVYELTHSKLMLGLSVFATLFPSAVFSFLGGVVADRYHRYRVLLLTQALSMVQAALLALAAWWWPAAVWPIIGLSAVLGVINAFDVPARQSLVYEMVDDKQDLPNALALNSSMVNLSKLLGPALAGLALERLGAAACFGLNAVSFVAVIGSVLALRLAPYVPRATTKNVLTELREGLSYVRDTPRIRFIILMMALVSLTLLPFTALMPVYAKDVFRGSATTFGLLESAIGLGAFLGALYLTALRPGTHLGRVLMRNTFVFGVGLLLLAFAPGLWWALPFCAVAAFGMMSQVTISNTQVQTTVAPDMRGRVISLYVMAYTGLLPLGSLLVGAVAQHIGVQHTVLLEGVAGLLIGGLHLRELRRETARQPVTAPPAPALVQEAQPV